MHIRAKKADYEARICTILDGLAAEKAMLGDASDGGGGGKYSDVAEATKIPICIEA